MLAARSVRAVAPALSPRPLPPRTSTLCSSSSSPSTRILAVGDALRLKRSFFEADIAEYARLTGDCNPLHFDADRARNIAGFDGPIVHGMLVASLFPALIASHFPGAIYISQTLHFKLPVYTGEELVAEVRPLNLRENRKRFIAKFLTKCFKKGEQLVLDGEALAILPTLAYKE